MAPTVSSQRHAMALGMAGLVLGGCGGAATPEQGPYATYECPAPIKTIVRDDCDRYALRYDGTQVEGGVDVGPLGGARGLYVDKATREADILVQVLKEQRVGLCHSFNTCKMTREEYRREQQRIDDTSSVLLAMRERLPGASAEEARDLLGRLSTMRSTNDAAPVQAPRAEEQAPAPTAPPSASSPGTSEWTPGHYMKQALDNATRYAKRLEESSTFGFDNGSACIVGGYLQAGHVLTLKRPFRAGVQYVVLGGGSDSTEDLDIGVFDASGRALAADVETDAAPLVDVTVPTEGTYEVRVKLEKARGHGAFIALAMLHEGGYSVPADRFVSSMTGALEMGARASRRGPPVVFHEADEWSFYGVVLQPQQAWTSPDVSFETRPSLALGAADDRQNDIDLGIRVDGSMVAVDKEDDGTPVVEFAPPSGPANVIVTNPGRSTAFVSVLLLDAEVRPTTM